MEHLRYYIAYNAGMEVMRGNGNGLQRVGEFFTGRTLEDVKGLRSRPEVVFAAVAFDGGYRTVDGGKTWQKIMDGDVRCFSVDPHDERVIYMGTAPIRLYHSEDTGATWEPLDAMLALPAAAKEKWGKPPGFAGPGEAHVRHIFVHPDDPRILLVALEHGGVVLSRDGGATWDDRSNGIGYVDMHMIENYPGSTERYFVSSAQGFYRTDDAGKHWYRSEKGMPWDGQPRYCYSHEWRFVPGSPPRMVVCGGRGSPGVWIMEKETPHGHILLSDDGGEDWRFAAHGLGSDEPWMPWALASLPSDERTLFCGLGDGSRGFAMMPHARGRGGVVISRDAGESWEPVLTDTAAVTTLWVAPD